ncbi:30S ribosomal protein S8 [Candidatus Woesearchaeota archaeon]|nr:30S ribosomal protein S8 [uncultured archaeon]MBS3166974.1 30S ribosomal protein S8 [Candidatus Woesearchaeota archaeon]
MTLNDPIANALSMILNYERIGKSECYLRVSSNLLKEILTLINEKGYIGTFEVIKSTKGESLKINLIGKINKCGVIKPRFSVKKDEYEKYEKRFLPSNNFGYLIVSTPKGLMLHETAKEKKLGGRLIAYIY